MIRLDLHHFFDHVITSEEAGAEKPDKHIFECAIEKMGCDVERSVMVGNKFSEDILGAVNVGMSAILVNSELKDSEKEYIKEKGIKIDVISHIGELKDIL